MPARIIFPLALPPPVWHPDLSHVRSYGAPLFPCGGLAANARIRIHPNIIRIEKFLLLDILEVIHWLSIDYILKLILFNSFISSFVNEIFHNQRIFRRT
jgi:hypothetical protein